MNMARNNSYVRRNSIVPCREVLAAPDTRRVTYWVSADGQGSLDMTGCTASEALEELCRECCGSSADVESILDGRFELE